MFPTRFIVRIFLTLITISLGYASSGNNVVFAKVEVSNKALVIESVGKVFFDLAVSILLIL